MEEFTEKQIVHYCVLRNTTKLSWTFIQGISNYDQLPVVLYIFGLKTPTL